MGKSVLVLSQTLMELSLHLLDCLTMHRGPMRAPNKNTRHPLGQAVEPLDRERALHHLAALFAPGSGIRTLARRYTPEVSRYSLSSSKYEV